MGSSVGIVYGNMVGSQLVGKSLCAVGGSEIGSYNGRSYGNGYGKLEVSPLGE